MAAFGANYPCFLATGKTTGVVLGKLVSANLTVNNATGELYADDILAENVSEFSSGSIAMEVDNLSDDVASAIFGCEVSDGVATYAADDEAPEGGLAYYKSLMVNGRKKYRAYYYPRVRAAVGNDSASTKGSSISFQTDSVEFTVMALADTKAWKQTEEFATSEEAVTWIKSQCKVS